MDTLHLTAEELKQGLAAELLELGNDDLVMRALIVLIGRLDPTSPYSEALAEVMTMRSAGFPSQSIMVIEEKETD